MSGDRMKEMAELLRTGATMLSYSCPECQSPLFQLKNKEIWCQNCQRQVVIVPEGEESKAEAGLQLIDLEKALVSKLASFTNRITDEDEPEKLRETSEVIDSLLTTLKKLREVKGI